MRKILVVGVLLTAVLTLGVPSPQAQDVRLQKIQEFLAESLTVFESGGEAPPLPANKLEDLKAGKVRVVLEATRASEVSALRTRVEALSGRVEAVYDNLVQAFVPIKSVNALAGLNAVSWVRTPFVPIWEQGNTISEGMRVIGANLWHDAGIKGQGVKVAIIDNGFKGYQRLLGSELPPAERIIVRSFRSDEDIEADERHGTAVAEIVYDLAPEATFYLVNFDTDVQFGQATDFLIAEGVHVINTSLGFFGTGCPWEGTGLIEPIVKKARDAGIFWAAAMGNNATEHWQGVFDDPDKDGFHNFLSDDEGLTLDVDTDEVGEVIAVLSWEDKCGKATENYELLLFDDADRRRASGSQLRSGWPSRLLVFTVRESGRYHLKIRQRTATKPTAQLDVSVIDIEPEYSVWEGSVGAFEPAISPNAFSVGATDFRNDSARRYSSRGPTKDGRIKPDFAAPDGVRTTSFRPFFGTSAASPHVAGAAALVKSVRPEWGPKEIADFLASRAIDRGDDGPDNTYGAGRIELPSLVVQPNRITFEAHLRDAQPPSPQNVSISNRGSGSLAWSASTEAPWLRFEPAEGTTPTAMNIMVDPSGLAPGIYEARVDLRVKDVPAASSTLTVVLDITNPPLIGVFPGKLSFTVQAGGPNPAPQLLEIANLGGEELAWNIKTDAPWIKLPVTGGTGLSLLPVGVDITGLAPGVYEGKISIVAKNASNSPLNVVVQLQVVEGPLAGELVTLFFSKLEFVTPSAWARSERGSPSDGCLVYTNNSSEAQRLCVTLADSSSLVEYDVPAGNAVTACGNVLYVDLRPK